MSNEIKEILFLLHNDRLTESGKRKLEDYITNLQEKYDKCKKQKIKVENACSNYKYIIDKAIEYIEHQQNYSKVKVIYVNGNDLLNILKGSDIDESKY